MAWWPLAVLIGLVALIERASRHARLQRYFRWLPIPLWCYAIPMLLTSVGWLPAHAASYGWITAELFPVALVLLLLGTDLGAVRRLGSQALLAMGIGALGIVCAGPVMGWLLRAHLPPEAWKGIGTLAATWTGGSMNMMALRSILDVPDTAFAPLIVVDALVAYGWMAFLIAGQGGQERLNRWLRAMNDLGARDSRNCGLRNVECGMSNPKSEIPNPQSLSVLLGALGGLGLIAIGVTVVCRWAAQWLPREGVVVSVTGWTVLLATTLSLLLAGVPSIRRLGSRGAAIGYPCLYLVLAALGAQASPRALAAAPVWAGIGVGMLAGHVLLLLLGGRIARIPWAVLATASQANVGGVVSAPLVGAVYHRALAPVGLLLAVAGNAVGTYLGVAAAAMSRWLT